MKQTSGIFSFEFKNRSWFQLLQIGTSLLTLIFSVLFVFMYGFRDTSFSLLFCLVYALFFFWIGTRPYKEKKDHKYSVWKNDILDSDIQNDEPTNNL